jgi:homoserine dehydrogenase
MKPLNIGIIGLGTVGMGLIKCLINNKNIIKSKSERVISIAAICAKNKNKKRDIDIGNLKWVQDPFDITDDKEIDVVVELIGGDENPSKSIVEKSLLNKKHVVTANKALIAKHGHYLALLAEEQQVCLNFEAAVAGAIPIIKAIKESLSGNVISKVYGVINGTCNYILTQMEKEEKEYTSIFKKAQQLGYVEKDPQLDVGGIDSAHKISILTTCAFGTRINFENVIINGIQNISLIDIKNAFSMGYKIKLMALALRSDDGIIQEVEPCLVPKDSIFGKLEGGTNLVMVEGDFSGRTYYMGPGAGSGPTASAVIADIIDIANGKKSCVFGMNANLLELPINKKKDFTSSFYLRFLLTDKPGTLAQLSSILGKYEISINRMNQLHHIGETAPILIVTHPTTKNLLKPAIEEINQLEICINEPVIIKIEEF